MVPFKLDEHRFAQNVRSARRGAAPGPSGMTNEHFLFARSLVESIPFPVALQGSRGMVTCLQLWWML